MKLNELLEPGDVINTKYHDCHYVVTSDEAWNRLTKTYDEFIHGSWGFTYMPAWIKSIVRGAVDVTDKIQAELEVVEFKFGDRVTHVSSDGEVGVVIERQDDTTYVVAFNGSNSHGPFIETHPARKLRPA